jgi:hypothetical protein
MAGGKQESFVYSIAQDKQRDSLVVKEVAASVPVQGPYADLITTSARGQTYLVGRATGANHLDVYHFTAAKPWLKKLAPQPKIDAKTDILDAFLIGNAPHLVAYTAKNGVMLVYALKHDFSLTKPYEFFRNHEPSLTQGFTTLKSFTAFGQVVFLGYNGTNGYVAMYSVGVTGTSPADVPPLLFTPAWAHMWAKGWTRFAFFQLGGENFFLKTNTWKLNVNIDHVMDVLSAGTAEVGTELAPKLDNAKDLDICQSFTLGSGEPYFVSYLAKTGALAFYRFHSDCLGWTAVAQTTTKKNASQVVPVTTPTNEVYLVVA